MTLGSPDLSEWATTRLRLGGSRKLVARKSGITYIYNELGDGSWHATKLRGGQLYAPQRRRLPQPPQEGRRSMTPETIRRRLASLAQCGEQSILDPDVIPQTEWWQFRRPGPCEACADTGSVPVAFGTVVIDTVPCPHGCTGHPAD